MIAGRVTALVGDAFLPGEPGDAWEGVAETPALILLSLQITEEGSSGGFPASASQGKERILLPDPWQGFYPLQGGTWWEENSQSPWLYGGAFLFPLGIPVLELDRAALRTLTLLSSS